MTFENRVVRANKEILDLNERLEELRRELVVFRTAPAPPKESADEVRHLKEGLFTAENRIVCLNDTVKKQQD